MVKGRQSDSEKEIVFMQLVPHNPRDVTHQCHYGEEKSTSCMGLVQYHQSLFSGCLLGRALSSQYLPFAKIFSCNHFQIHPAITQPFFANLDSRPSPLIVITLNS